MFFNVFINVSQYVHFHSNWKKILEFRNMQEKLENNYPVIQPKISENMDSAAPLNVGRTIFSTNLWVLLR